MKTIFTTTLVALGLCMHAQHKQQPFRAAHTGELAAKTQAVAPDNTYSFLTYTAAYQSITGTSLTQGKKWDEPEYTLPIGFNFKLYGKQGTSIHFYSGNALSFDQSSSSSAAFVAAMNEDLCDRAFNPDVDDENDPGGISNISYTTTGTTPNQLCTIQVDNAGFISEIDSLHTANSFINYQIRLFETSNVIEFHYGNAAVQHADLCFFNSAGFECDLLNITNTNTFAGTGNILTGSFANPNMVGFSAFATTPVVSGTIENGRVYKFSNTTTPVATAITKIAADKTFKLYPNPAKNKLFIESAVTNPADDSRITIYDLTGKAVYSDALSNEIVISGLQQGLYIVKIKSGDATLYTSKLVIAE